MKAWLLTAGASVALAGCTGPLAERGSGGTVSVKVIAFNDFHGHLEPPKQTVDAPARGPDAVKVPAGGVAYLATAVEQLRAANPNHVVVSAGDMVGASPLVSALFLDEPTIHAMNLIKLDFNAVGNHEFDRGRPELLRLQKGGCEKHTPIEPCRLEPFPGARFSFLAANTITEQGTPLFAPYAIRSFGSGSSQVQVAFIGMTLKETPSVASPAGIAGLEFRDEAETANALIPKIRAEGADAIVVVIHQGASTKVGYNDKSCAGMDGELLPVLARLDPAVDVVVSGHTHNAYVCDYGSIDAARPFLVTSAGRYGTLLTDIELSIDSRTSRVVAKRADNLIVQGEGFSDPAGAVTVSDRYPRYSRNPAVAALVQRYAAAAAPLSARVVGRLSAPAPRPEPPPPEYPLGNLIADAQLAATSGAGAQIAFMNRGGIRAGLVPAEDGAITYGQLFAAQPFGNTLITKSFSGRQIREILEQQFESGSNTVAKPNILMVSRGFSYSYDLSRPAGQRIGEVRLNGAPLKDEAIYRVTMNNFLSSGGDNFTGFTRGSEPAIGRQDVDVLEAYIAANSPLAPPPADRLRDLTPK